MKPSRLLTAAVMLAALAVPAVCQVSGPQAHPCNPLVPGRCTPDTRPVVLLLGSSTALGYGASSTATSWAGLLSAYLGQRGFSFVNDSIPGTETTDSIARFDRDVRPHAPAFVILATSFANEGVTEDNVAEVSQRYVQNSRKLMLMVESIGAIPITITPYPHLQFTPVIRSAILDISRQLESDGVTVWDFFSAADDGQGRWLPGLSADGDHPTDAGHLRLFNSIPVTFFDWARDSVALNRPLGLYGSWRAMPGSDGAASLRIILPFPSISWSLSLWLRPDVGTPRSTVATINGPGVTLIRDAESLQLVNATRVLLSAPMSNSGAFVHISITWKERTGVVKLEVGGAVVASASVPLPVPAQVFTIGGGAEGGLGGDGIAGVRVYRTPLADEDITGLAFGRIPARSTEADLPLAQSPDRQFVNAAPTRTGTAIVGTWEWVADGPGIGAAGR